MKQLGVVACVLIATTACGTGSNVAPTVGFRATPAHGDIEVEAYPTAFDVVDKLGQAPADGEGHIHFYLDVDPIPTSPGKPAVTSDAGTYHATARTTHAWRDVSKGTHSLGVQLVNNDHTPLDPPVFAQQDVRVE